MVLTKRREFGGHLNLMERQYRAKPERECVTTRAKARTSKWTEARRLLTEHEIVSSAWRHAAAARRVQSNELC